MSDSTKLLAQQTKVHLVGQQDGVVFTVESSKVYNGRRFYRLREVPGGLFLRGSLKLVTDSAKESIDTLDLTAMQELCVENLCDKDFDNSVVNKLIEHITVLKAELNSIRLDQKYVNCELTVGAQRAIIEELKEENKHLQAPSDISTWPTDNGQVGDLPAR
jgi:hypothetical protein